MDEDNIIPFPARGEPSAGRGERDPGERISPAGSGVLGLDGLTGDQEKAIEVVLSGMPFVCVGISPTATGADFFTAVDGAPADLAAAAPHLPGVIGRALEKRGVTGG